MGLKDISNVLRGSDKIALSSHINPDGDALGSMFALAEALRKFGKEVDIYLQDEIPKEYRNFFNEKFINYRLNKNKNYDSFVCLDISTFDRLGDCEEIKNYAKKIINIDHHISNEGICEYSYVDVEASATCEIIYELIKFMNIDITDEIAKYLYIGIMTDTGGLKYNNTTPKTLIIVSELIKYNLDIATICRQIFDLNSLKKLKVLGYALETLKLYCNGKIAILHISRDLLKKLEATYEDCSGIVNYTRSIEGVKVGILLIENEDNNIKVSLRSNDDCNVADISTEFNGGGHKRAAGFNINFKLNAYKDIEDLKEKLINMVSERIN